jgi:hypothetical protein
VFPFHFIPSFSVPNMSTMKVGAVVKRKKPTMLAVTPQQMQSFVVYVILNLI